MDYSTLSNPNLRVLSASKIKTYAGCARKYKYAYIDRLDQEKHPAAILGSSIHKSIERIYRNPTLEPNRLQVYLECYNEEVTKSETTYEQRYVRDGAKMIQLFDFDKRTPKELELEFVLEFPNKAHPLCYIHGYMDQVFDAGFVDLKSNARKPGQFVLDNDLQFILYDWGFTELMGYEPDFRIWNHLRTGEDLEADVAGKLDDAQREVEKILDAEATGIYDKHTGDWCRWCSFQEPCLGKKY